MSELIEGIVQVLIAVVELIVRAYVALVQLVIGYFNATDPTSVPHWRVRQRVHGVLVVVLSAPVWGLGLWLAPVVGWVMLSIATLVGVAFFLFAALRTPSSIEVRRFFRHKPGQCPVCEYDLRENKSGACPECGWKIPRRRLRKGI